MPRPSIVITSFARDDCGSTFGRCLCARAHLLLAAKRLWVAHRKTPQTVPLGGRSYAKNVGTTMELSGTCPHRATGLRQLCCRRTFYA